MKEIAIIGAGLSGILLATNLLRQKNNQQVNIKLIDSRDKNDLGAAYSTNEDYLLNVPVEKMGAFPSEPDHFIKWVKMKNIPVAEGNYLPRKLYRKYILEQFNSALADKSDSLSFERIKEEVIDIKTINNRSEVITTNGKNITADKVVLAIGNAPPSNPRLKNNLFTKDKRYIQNPWDTDLLKNISPGDNILFIGTGQTTVDILTALYKNKHKGKLICISRRGFFPLSQKKVDAYPSFFDELKDLNDLPAAFKVVRKHLRLAEEKGFDSRAVIDSLRPHTQTIWMNFPLEEKKRFLRHVQRYWEIIRSRIPPSSHKIITELKSSGQMKIVTGRLTEIIPSENSLEVRYFERGKTDESSFSVNVVINCVGPCQDYEKINQPLIKNLLKKKIIQCDPVYLGINALPEGNVIQEDAKPSDKLYAIGLPLKGILWESLAAPEIRLQAVNLSKTLLL